MLWFSLRLALQGGREAVTRLIATAVAVAIGVTMLLAVLAQFHGFQVSSQRPCWECTTKTQQSKANTADNALWWLYRKDTYRGHDIKRLDVAAFGPHAPLPPGIEHLPKDGEYYTSPAMAELLRTAPRDELGARFPGKQIGTIGNEALSGRDALVIFVGRKASDISSSPRAFQATTINTKPKAAGTTTNFVRFAFGIGAAGLLFPMLILIGTATRLSAARREERYAALRLAGATPGQINQIASVDAVVSAALGAIIGTGIFLLLQPAIANTTLTGERYFIPSVTPTIFGYAAMLIGVPGAAAAASLLSLRQVRISPLGVSRKVTPTTPKPWTVLPLLIGIILFIGGAFFAGDNGLASPIVLLSFVLILAGLILAGPWLTVRATRLMARLANGPASLLAARRLADNPRAAFRAVSGLVMAVFVGTVFAIIAPAILAEQKTAKNDAMTNVLAAEFYSTGDAECVGDDDACHAPADPGEGLADKDASKLLGQLREYKGAEVFPIYVSPHFSSKASGKEVPPPNDDGPKPPAPPQTLSISLNTIMSCKDIHALQILGSCPPGITAMTVQGDALIVNQNHAPDPVVDGNSKVIQGDYTHNPLRAVLVRVHDASSLEKVRTYLARNAISPSSEVPRTWGEVRQDQFDTVLKIQQFVFAGMALTLLIAGCSLAVSVSGSLVERKRPFTLLRLSGTPMGALYRVVLLESIVPLVAVTLIAVVIGFGLAGVMLLTLAPAGTPLTLPGSTYYLTVCGGLVLSVLVVGATLPLLRRITQPDNARFE